MESFNKVPERIKEGLKLIPPGFMFFDFKKEKNQTDDNSCVTFIIKDELSRLKKLKPIVNFEMITVVMDIDNILLIDVMVQFDDIKDTLYECNINAKDEDWGKIALNQLSS